MTLDELIAEVKDDPEKAAELFMLLLQSAQSEYVDTLPYRRDGSGQSDAS